jgi:hypothetical protein
MIALRLVRLIESHSEQLSDGLIHKLLKSERTADLRKVPASELHARCHEIYRNLSEWLVSKTEADIERVYGQLGARRASQGVSLSALSWAIMMTKEHLWSFLEREGLLEKPMEILGELELLRLLDQFFDRAVYYATRGYESYISQQFGLGVLASPLTSKAS